MTKAEYLEHCEQEIVGLTLDEAVEKGYYVVLEKPERFSVRAAVLVELKDDKIDEVLEII